MAGGNDKAHSILSEAIDVWKNAKRVYFSAWKGQPREGYFVQVLATKKDIEPDLVKLLDHQNGIIVAYVLVALLRMESAKLDRLPQKLCERDEIITEVIGSFVTERTLGDFANEIQKAWRDKHSFSGVR